jgi:hypothetical protein
VSTELLYALVVGATDLMILARSSKGQRRSRGAVAHPQRPITWLASAEGTMPPTACPSSQPRAARLPIHAARKPTAVKGEDASTVLEMDARRQRDLLRSKRPPRAHYSDEREGRAIAFTV